MRVRRGCDGGRQGARGLTQAAALFLSAGACDQAYAMAGFLAAAYRGEGPQRVDSSPSRWVSNVRFWTSMMKRLCGAQLRGKPGKRCQKPAITGRTRCRLHGG